MKGRPAVSRSEKHGQPYEQATTGNLYLDRVGNPNEWEPKQLKKISDFLLGLGIIRKEKMKNTKVENIVKEELSISGGEFPSEGVMWHLTEGVSFDKPVYRAGTEKYFSLISEARGLYERGLYVPKSEFEADLLESDLGKWGVFEGRRVPLDFPMRDERLNEAEYKGRKVELGKPKHGEGGKSYVYVRNPKTGKVIKVNFGSSLPDAMGDSPAHRARRKSFGDRHQCAKKKDRTKAGYWACRATKFFGRNIPGWW